MKFCRQCGTTLSIFAESRQQLCPVCLQKVTPTKTEGNADSQQRKELLTASLTAGNGRLYLQSEEGWLLWSGDVSEKHTLEKILKQAEKILAIRKRKIR